MGSNFYRLKIGLYVLVIVMVGSLFAVRLHNAWQKTNYTTDVIFRDGDIEISLHYPAKIFSPKIDASYPLALSFYYKGDIQAAHIYEIFLQSPTLLFVDAKGVEVTPHFQFTSNRTFFEQNIYVRPYLSEDYPVRHVIDIQAFVDGQEAQTQTAWIEIKTEPPWFSFLSLAAASLVEISVATALITWIVNAMDASSTARKDRVAKIREALNSLSSLSYLEQMDKVRHLEDEVRDEHLDDDVGEEVQRVKGRFKEEEFFRALGNELRQGKDKALDARTAITLHAYYFGNSKRANCLTKLTAISQLDERETLPALSTLLLLWDEFDVDAKDLIVSALRRPSKKVVLSSIPATELLRQVFTNSNRRRLLRDVEIRMLFPQLDSPPAVGYDTTWLRLPNPPINPRVLDYLKQHDLVVNPFGTSDLMSYPFYPEGSLFPDGWDDFLVSLPQNAQCLTSEDTKVLAFLLRSECIPVKETNAQGDETPKQGKQAFPVRVSFEQTMPLEPPLVTLARSAANAWLDILPFSPDAMLDLLPARQIALLELLCWTFGSSSAVINLLSRDGLRDDNASARLLVRKIGEFKTEFSSAHLPQDSVVMSWLKIRPPDLNSTYLIVPLDEIPATAKGWWLEQFNPLIPALFLNGIVTKAFSSSQIADEVSLSAIRLNWSDKRLKSSLKSQFDMAMDKAKQKDMGKEVDFRSLFGSDPAIGYFATEEETIERLITASNNSLARMLNLGNRLLQYHCEHRQKDGVPEKYLYVKDLETILSEV